MKSFNMTKHVQGKYFRFRLRNRPFSSKKSEPTLNDISKLRKFAVYLSDSIEDSDLGKIKAKKEFKNKNITFIKKNKSFN